MNVCTWLDNMPLEWYSRNVLGRGTALAFSMSNLREFTNLTSFRATPLAIATAFGWQNTKL